MRAGVLCPVDKARITDEECLACRTGTPRVETRCHYPYEILKGMMDGSGRETAHISATMLGGCKRQTWLEAREKWWMNPDTSYPALRGTVGHAFIEKYPEPGAIAEVRFEAEIDGHKITGQIDKLHPGSKKITDFKTKAEDKNPLAKPQSDHVLQLNVYRWLVKHGWPQQLVFADAQGNAIEPLVPGTPANIEIAELELAYWTFGWSKLLQVPILSEDEVLTHITNGIKILQREEPPAIPPGLDPFKEKCVLCTVWCDVREACMRHELDDGLDLPPF